MFNLRKTIKESLAQVRKNFEGSNEEFDARVKSNYKAILTDAAEVFLIGVRKFYEKTRIAEIESSFSRFQQSNEAHHKVGFQMYLMYIDLTVTINADMPKLFDVDKFPNGLKIKFNQILQLHIKAPPTLAQVFRLARGHAETCALHACSLQTATYTPQHAHT